MRQSRRVSGTEGATPSMRRSDECVGEVCPSRVMEDPETISLSFVLENDPALLPGVISQLLEAAGRLCLFDEATAQRVGLALHEAMVNAIDHGNLELDSALRQRDESAYHHLAASRRRLPPYHRRRLHVRARIGSTVAIFVISDQGRGFDPARLPDPTGPDCIECPSGRGLLLIRTFMDEVLFNPAGNQITLVKRRTPREPGAAPMGDEMGDRG